ncbi:flagellar biosynthetic protein FliR [Sphingomicrobium astaxanthinifaciens]|uniref:flagellar biosynthetic protein FliR n=1 Tax=Sphingomicrobium astaxanthinifaciens TaxID=1227949 RepID=UPI001FCAC060|nr:flagellar biosynthetic protein FliR [Sphingomicrobium astaxanthinifaciens]MCJ7420355.1 flagellar biosynthetic protein FliR [Sphingomicrobium astaxanthinifaciens]
MSESVFALGELENQFWQLAFLMIRVGAALVVAPFFSAAAVPALVRVSVAGAVAIFILHWVPVVGLPSDLFSVPGMIVVVGEILVGLCLGFVLQIAFAAPLIAAEMISGAMGMSMAITGDPASGGQTTAYGQFFSVVLVLIFLTLGAHVQWLGLVIESFRAFPPGETWLGADRMAEVAAFGGVMFETAVRIALPVTVILFLVQVITGILSRSAPSLNLFSLGLPAGVLAGICALLLSTPLIYQHLSDLIATALLKTESLVIR